MTPVATIETIVLTQVKCPLGHRLPVWLPAGIVHEMHCRKCGRRYSAKERPDHGCGHEDPRYR